MVHVIPSSKINSMSQPDAYWLLHDGHVLSLNYNLSTKLAIKKAIKAYKKQSIVRKFLPPIEFYTPDISHIIVCASLMEFNTSSIMAAILCKDIPRVAIMHIPFRHN